MTRITYTISVKKWWGWRSYRVHNHVAEAVGSTAWWVLTLTDGSVLTIPDIGSKQVLIHPDFKHENERVKAEHHAIDEQARQRAHEIVRAQLPPLNGLSRPMVATGFVSQVPPVQ